ncbi:hypothetical protein AA101099_0506 [Neoasaia chiangmaiensis NBRC 101099]|uniref:Uncharacterized protein n=1 Tax=Neoasaia chiangmaiensis TaxID=320497 RepID=A0A1U9KTJ3_9PROT|nr:hypothetical protein [Neoasaia chiangmaiensis]AQS89062.1 hypothetical protein A0U93_15345 [Neoasaia chiangmaiensis]GBR36894.1 hypothetical protein AA101099_0506 [Neoasaia chiangmaiensis NBRC 101099]GEN16604.1 hypothetical protein NCH01_30350 [Neoasaia chiangmaiensis]
MAGAQKQYQNSTVQRSFRDLGRKEVSDPDKLDALGAMGLGGRLTWDDLLVLPRVLLISAAGAGKTHECRETARRLFADEKAAFFLSLEAVATTELSLLFDREQTMRYRQWLADGHSEAHFFLDSADELLLSHGSFRLALRKLTLAIGGQLHRAKIVVTSRPIALDFDAFASEVPVVEPAPPPDIARDPDAEFRRLISGEVRKQRSQTKKTPLDHDPQSGVRIVGLTPLSNEQIKQIAEVKKVKNIAGILAEIDHKRAWEFARRPQELIEICAYWNEYKRLGTRSEQIAEDIRHKLQETGERKRHIRLPDARALDGAERLALAQVLTRKRTIRFSDLSLDAHEAEAAIDPSIILHDWSESDRAELLQRPLFGFASYGRVRFHHRSTSEFLAAQRLQRLSADGQMSRAALFRLLFGECYGRDLVFPSMRPVAAWLAITNDAVRDEMVRREPEALMDDGDPESFSVNARSRILAAYVERYGGDGWRGVRIPYPQVLRFASSDLSPTVRRLWQERSTSPEVRELLIDLIQAARIEDCCDIATEVANDPQALPTDRVTAVTALAEMTAPGELSNLVASLLSEPHWPSRVKEGVIDPLFPKHLSAEEFVRLLGQINVDKRNVGGIEWTLPRLIPLWTLPDGEVTLLRDLLARLIEDSIERVEHWPHYASRYRHLTSALAAFCLRQFDNTLRPPEGLVEAAVIAARLKDNEFGDKKPAEEVIEWLRHAPRSWRKFIYLAEGHFCAAHVPARNDDEFGMNIVYGSTVNPIDYDDFDWLLEVAADTGLDQRIRAGAFRDALYLPRVDGQMVEDRVAALRDVAKDNPAWLEKLERWLVPAKPDQSYVAQEAEWKKQTEAREAEEAAAVQTWIDWRQDVLRDPNAYFSKASISKIVWDFAQTLESDPKDLCWGARWDSTSISAHFNDAITERVRAVFCAYWRTIEVPLRSERAADERNTVWNTWIHALAGVYAEAEQPGWARDLERKYAETATRLALVELNGLPPWIADLVTHQPEAVEATLGKELLAELDDAVSFEFPRLLGFLLQADQRVLEFCAPRVWAWLSTTNAAFDGDQQQARMNGHLEGAIDYLLRSSFDRSCLITLAQNHLSDGLGKPFALLWLMLLLSTAPQQAIGLLEQHIGMLDPPTRYRLCENLFAMLGDRRSVRFCLDLTDQDFTPAMLLSLVRLAYAEIRLSDDIDRAGGGVFSPTARDEAQDGRGAVLSALLAHTGAEAWAIKQAMRNDPLFARFKDRLDQIAREKAASEAEGPPLADRDLSQIELYGEAPQVGCNGMFRLMMDRLADLQHDIRAHEFSERSILVGIEKEKDMQVWFAKRLQERENGAYRVDREALVVNDKETDIRLLSVRSNAKAVIELKLANNGYSVVDLEKALECQLVGQYMQHDDCRAGCLLVTMNERRTWRCPDTGSAIDFSALLGRLHSFATSLEVQLNHQVRLAVVGIDLTG